MRGTGWVWALVTVGGCNCRPELPQPPTHSDETDPPPTGETADSSVPAGPCDVPEIEPNDALQQGTPLLLERHACGAFASDDDQDHWSFELEEDAWLLARLRQADGSLADPSLLLSPPGGEWAALKNDDPDSVDATLLFPAPAGAYVVKAAEQTFSGGDRFGYDLVVSEGKAPVAWTRAEVEPNDTQALAETVVHGDVVFGTMTGNGALPDFDWYRIEIPAGKHTLSFEITAFDEGSSGDLTIYLYDEALGMLPDGCRDPCPQSQPACVPCAVEGGIRGVERDPVGEYVSAGGEVVWIQVQESAARESPASWYVLDLGLEGS